VRRTPRGPLSVAAPDILEPLEYAAKLSGHG